MEIKKLCGCGCGQEIEIKEYHKRYGIPTYVNGHNGKGKPRSEEIRMKISRAHKGKIFSEEHRQKLSEAKKGKNHPNYGKHLSEELRKKMSKLHSGEKNPFYGKTHTKETLKKISEANKGKLVGEKNPMYGIHRVGKDAPMYGKHHTIQSREQMGESRSGEKNYLYGKHIPLEIRKKMSEANKGKKRSLETRKKIRNARAKRIFPIKDTSIEVKTQDLLRQLGFDFFTHQYMKIEHGYQCDILIPTLNLVIECDGDYWHKYPVGNELDHIRTKELLEKGFKVLRLWEKDIKVMDLKGFEDIIVNIK